MIEVVVGQDQDLEQVLIETELDVSNVGNMTTLPKIVQIFQRVKCQAEQLQQMLDSEKNEAALTPLALDTY